MILLFPTGVIAATVNVLCELARHDPKEYLSLAPQLFHLLTTSSNNWMLIKIIKLVRLMYVSFSHSHTFEVWFPVTVRAAFGQEITASDY